MKNNTIVVKPSQKMVSELGWDSMEEIVLNGYAQGFRGSAKIVGEFSYIVVTDGYSKAFLGFIDKVEHAETISKSGNAVSRVNINFSNTHEIKFDLVRHINWSSLNVRYIYLKF